MNLRSLLSAPIKKALRVGLASYIVLSVVSTLFYCSCTSGSFYVLNTGQYLAEHSKDRPFIISTEYKNAPETRHGSALPIYKVGENYYVAAAQINLRKNMPVLSTVGSAPEPYYYTSMGEKAYYEVELTARSEVLTFSLPPNPRPAFAELPADTPSLIAYFRPFASYPSVAPAMEAGSRAPTYTCEQTGDIQLRLIEPEDTLSWRAVYGLPSAALLFVAVDIPFDLISFTGFCIRSLFD